MRTTLSIDDDLLAEAERICGTSDATVLVHEGLRALIRREVSRRLVKSGGTEPELESIPRRRSEPE